MFDRWLQFSGEGRENEVEFVVALGLVHGRPSAAPQQTQLEVRPEDLQQVRIRLEVCEKRKGKPGQEGLSLV